MEPTRACHTRAMGVGWGGVDVRFHGLFGLSDVTHDEDAVGRNTKRYLISNDFVNVFDRHWYVLGLVVSLERVGTVRFIHLILY